MPPGRSFPAGPARVALRPIGLASLVLLGGCQRGCLATWLDTLGASSSPTAPTPSAAPAAAEMLDCPDGLGRCVDGVVEVSRLAQVPPRCTGPQCACPWDAVTTCAHGCVADGVTLDVPSAAAAVQLCASDDVVARPFPSAVDAGVSAADCEPGGHRCVAGAVVACGGGGAAFAEMAPRAVAICVLGCAAVTAGASGEFDETVTDAQAALLLCARARTPTLDVAE